MKQTAVEWLESELKNSIGMPYKHFEEIINQAKAMEKEQIIEAFHKQTQKFLDKEEAEQYYNETFKSEKNDKTDSNRMVKRDI